MDAFLLCGGYGKRLGKITKKVPKPFLKINNKPFIQYIINNLVKAKITNIYLLCSYKSNFFFKEFHKKKIKKTNIFCIKEPKQLGTGGAILNAKKKLKGKFLVLNADSHFKIDLDTFIKKGIKQNCYAKIAVTLNKYYKSNNKLSNLQLNKNNLLLKSDNGRLMNGGIYLIKKYSLLKISKKKFSLEKNYIEKIMMENKVEGQYFKNNFIDIGLVKNFNRIKAKPHKYLK
jgi:NDP-sugar pyrophosphorylase family protein